MPISVGIYSERDGAVKFNGPFVGRWNEPAVSPIDPPTTLDSTAKEGGVNLLWDAVPGATQYRVETSPTSATAGFTTFADVTTRGVRVEPLDTGVTHWFRVRSINADGAISTTTSPVVSNAALAPAAADAPPTEPAEGFAGPGTVGRAAMGNPAFVKTVNGNYTTQATNEVIRDWDIKGELIIKHKGVKVHTSRILKGVTAAPNKATDAALYNYGAEFHYCDVGPRNHTERATLTDAQRKEAFGFGGYKVFRCDITGFVDAFKVNTSFGDVLVEDTWVHAVAAMESDPYQGGGDSHADILQTQGGGNIILRRNRLDNFRFFENQTWDGFAGQRSGAGGQTKSHAALMVTLDNFDAPNITYESNHLDGYVYNYFSVGSRNGNSPSNIKLRYNTIDTRGCVNGVGWPSNTFMSEKVGNVDHNGNPI